MRPEEGSFLLMAAEVMSVASVECTLADAPSRIGLLANMAAAGDVAAFDELVSIHAARVANLAYRLVYDATDAEDVAQEAFVKAFRSLPRLRDRSQFTGWMLKITTNAARDFLRRRSRRDEVCLEEARNTAAPDPTAELIERRETQDRIQDLLDTMPAKHRVVLVLRDIEELSYEEMAVALGCTVSSVKNRLHRARAAFRTRARPYISEVL